MELLNYFQFMAIDVSGVFNDLRQQALYVISAIAICLGVVKFFKIGGKGAIGVFLIGGVIYYCVKDTDAVYNAIADILSKIFR